MFNMPNVEMVATKNIIMLLPLDGLTVHWSITISFLLILQKWNGSNLSFIIHGRYKFSVITCSSWVLFHDNNAYNIEHVIG